jgi:hypothetical protein
MIIAIGYNKYIFDTSDISTDDRPLRRSVQGSVRYSAIASQFTQSGAKGRTLHLPVLYSTRSATVYSEL